MLTIRRANWRFLADASPVVLADTELAPRALAAEAATAVRIAAPLAKAGARSTRAAAGDTG